MWVLPCRISLPLNGNITNCTKIGIHQLNSVLHNYIQKASIFSPFNVEIKREFAESRIIGFSREQMFKVVSDVENYTRFLPWCESSIVKLKKSHFIEADLIIGMKPVTESYTSKVTLHEPSQIIAQSDNGAHFKMMITKWKFLPGLRTVPKSSIVDFYVSLEFKSLIHAQIANVFFNEVVRSMTGAFFDEAKRRYGEPSIESKKIIIKKDSNTKKRH